MNYVKCSKLKIVLLLALVIALIASVCGLFGMGFARAERNNITLNGTSTFVTKGAEVWAHRVDKGVDADQNPVTEDYTMFVFKESGDKVDYTRHHLAYKWIYNAAEQSDEENAPVAFDKAQGWFGMKLGFELGTDETLDFEKLVITFESQQYTQTKDEKTVNYIVLYPTADKLHLNVLITDDEEEELPSNPAELSYDNLTITFSENSASGCYTVTVGDGTTSVDGVFENIGGTYAKYSSSSTTPVTPLSFKVEFPEESADGNDGDIDAKSYARLAIYELNGQSFRLTGAAEKEGHLAGGQITDDAPPVLCFNEKVPFVKYNGELVFNYQPIDVITSDTTPSVETYYFMLTDEQANPASGFDPENFTENGGVYRKVTDADDQLMIPHVDHYKPSADKNEYNTSFFNKDFEVQAAVKVCFKLTDTTSTGGESTYVLLDWYVADWYGEEESLVKVNGNSYVAVSSDTLGATFAYTYDSANWDALVEAYKAKVEEAAADLKAGSKNYFYLPSLEPLLKDNATAYEDLTFSIYYNNGSRTPVTGKKSNNLSFSLSKSGKYIFTVYATDAAGNKMYYIDEKGEKKEFDQNSIWNMYDQQKDSDYEGTKKYLPWFEFTVSAPELTVEDPGEQATAYVGSSYTPNSFEINGVSYNPKYTLYLFENELYAAANGKALTYSEFMEDKETLLSEHREYFTQIKVASKLTEGTEDYEKFYDYNWTSSSLSFVPQVANAFYLIKLEVTSDGTDGGAQEAVAYMGIASAPQVRPLKGEDTWVQDNLTSIILLCIAGASLVGIIMLIVIKPRNKGDIDEQLLDRPVKKNKKK